MSATNNQQDLIQAQLPASAFVPQSGPLTAQLALGGYALRIATNGDVVLVDQFGDNLIGTDQSDGSSVLVLDGDNYVFKVNAPTQLPANLSIGGTPVDSSVIAAFANPVNGNNGLPQLDASGNLLLGGAGSFAPLSIGDNGVAASPTVLLVQFFNTEEGPYISSVNGDNSANNPLTFRGSDIKFSSSSSGKYIFGSDGGGDLVVFDTSLDTLTLNGTFVLNCDASGTPSSPLTPTAWIPVSLNGSPGFIPFYAA